MSLTDLFQSLAILLLAIISLSTTQTMKILVKTLGQVRQLLELLQRGQR